MNLTATSTSMTAAGTTTTVFPQNTTALPWQTGYWPHGHHSHGCCCHHHCRCCCAAHCYQQPAVRVTPVCTCPSAAGVSLIPCPVHFADTKVWW